MAKALKDPAAAMAAFDHVERDMRLLFGRKAASAAAREPPLSWENMGARLHRANHRGVIRP